MKVAAFLALMLMLPGMVAGQTSASPPRRFSLQATAGPTVIGGGNVLSAAFGFSPASRLDLLVTAERVHLPFELERFTDGYSVTRGGTLTFVGGELRVSLRPADVLSPFVVAGAGGGVSRPNINTHFPDAIRNGLRILHVGGGARVPLRPALSVVGDIRAMLAVEDADGVIAVWPVRLGVAWRF